MRQTLGEPHAHPSGAVRSIAEEPNATIHVGTSSTPASPSSCPSLLTIATRKRRTMMYRPGDRVHCVLPSCLFLCEGCKGSGARDNIDGLDLTCGATTGVGWWNWSVIRISKYDFGSHLAPQCRAWQSNMPNLSTGHGQAGDKHMTLRHVRSGRRRVAGQFFMGNPDGCFGDISQVLLRDQVLLISQWTIEELIAHGTMNWGAGATGHGLRTTCIHGSKGFVIPQEGLG